MGERTWSTGRVVWRDLLTPDVAAAEVFYAGLLGWKFESMALGSGPPYRVVVGPGGPIGGLAPMTPGARSPASWTSYVSVGSIDAALERARDRGGAVAMGPIEVPGEGRTAVLTDPWGASLGLYHATAGDAPLPDDPPVGAFCWETLVAPEPGAAVEFYRHVIGWTTGPAPGGAVTPILVAGRWPVADVQQAAPGRPAAWSTYVRVAALEPARDRAPSLGGAVVAPEIRIPEVGRVALIADAQGAPLALFEPPPR